MCRLSVILLIAAIWCRKTAVRALVTPLQSTRLNQQHTPHRPTLSARTTPLFSTLSDAAQWHKQRRKEMLSKYGNNIQRLETQASSQRMAVPLLLFGNLMLLCLSIVSGRMLSLPQTFLLALFSGSILSLWQLQILHDCLHGSMFNKSSSRVFGMISKHKLQEATLFWGSLPCVFGYYLYLKYGHLSHHSHVGDAQKASLQQLFSSDQTDLMMATPCLLPIA
jgi:hypothetical protein